METNKNWFVYPIIITVILAVLILYLCFPEPKGQLMQKQDEEAAELFISGAKEKVTKVTEEISESTEEETTETAEASSETVFTDDVIDNKEYSRDGITYTPEFAHGFIDCVLTIPSVGIKRNVYGGTMEDIQYNLDIWMTVKAIPSYELGKTDYVIYGHNHTVQDLSFNNLKNVQLGDYFTLTNSDGVYLYYVTDFFAQWRELVTREIVANKELPKDKAYIITCGRDQYRYKDIIVVGTLDRFLTFEEWEKLEHPERVPESIAAIEETQAEKKYKNLHYDIKQTENGIAVSLLNDNEKPVIDASLALFDEDGIVITDDFGDKMIWPQGVEPYLISKISPGDYVLGCYTIPDYCEAPYDMILTIDSNIKTELVESENDKTDLVKRIIVIICGCVIVLTWTFAIVQLKKERY